MKRWSVGVLGAGLLAIAPAGCTHQADSAPARPPVAVELAEARAADLTEAVAVVGALAPKLQAELKSEYSGTVAEVYVTEWADVRKGQPLASLDRRDAEAILEGARAAKLQAEVAESRATRELDRALQLKDVGLMTQQGIDEARTARDAAAAAVAAAKAQLHAALNRRAKVTIRAPFDGTVAFRGVNVGDRVENMGSGAPMFRVVDNRLLELAMSVPSAALATVRVGHAVEFAVDAIPGRTFRGAVSFINPSVEPQSRSAKVVADVRNPSRELRGGLFAKGRILTGTRSSVLQVPRAALQGWDVANHKADVFVVRNDVAERRTVRTGAVTEDRVEVSQGLAPGDHVVTRGAFVLRHGDRVRPARPSGA